MKNKNIFGENMLMVFYLLVCDEMCETKRNHKQLLERKMTRKLLFNALKLQV